MSTRDEIRAKISAAKDIKEEAYTHEPWGVSFTIRGMSGEARGRLMAGAYDGGTVNYARFYPTLLIESCYTTEGEKLFSEGDLDFLNSKSAESLEGPAQVAMRLSGLTKDDLAGAEKNSKAASDSSTE